MQNVNATKERILSVVQQKGPSFPVQIAKIINVSSLFTSVFLSELREDNKLRTSHMKVGSSSLFYIQGQEAQLENFIEYLNQREKEAFFMIKDSQVLEDEKQAPVMRVALRAIKDFAMPFKITVSGIEKIFWKYHLLSDEEFDRKVKRIFNPSAELADSKKEKKPEAEEQKNEIEKVREEYEKIISVPKQSIGKKKPVSDFADKIKDYLASKDIEILASIIEKKKEFAAKIRADTLFGKQEYYLVAKDKKKINETDFALVLQKAQAEKMIALILSPGEIDKRAAPYLKEWKNMVKFEKINI